MPNLRTQRRDAELDRLMGGQGEGYDAWLDSRVREGGDSLAPHRPVPMIEDAAGTEQDTDAWIGGLAREFDRSQAEIPDAPATRPADDGYEDAVRRGREAGSTGVMDVVAGFFDPGGVSESLARKKAAAEAPVKQWQEGQRLAQEVRRNDANEAYRRDSLEARQDASAGNLEARNRGLDIRENTALTPEQRRALQQSAADERIRVQQEAEAGKNRRTAYMSGNRRAMEEEGIVGPSRPPTTQTEAIADILAMRFEEAQVPMTPRMQRNIDMIKLFETDPRAAGERGIDNTRRRQLIDEADSYIKEYQKNHAESARHLGDIRREMKIPQARAQINKLEEILSQVGASGEDVPGLNFRDRLAAAVGGEGLRTALAGERGRRVLRAVADFRDLALEKQRTGMMANSREQALYGRLLATDFMSSPAEFLQAVEDIKLYYNDLDATLVQEAGVRGGEEFANRRDAASGISLQPRLRPGQSVTRGGRNFEVVE